MQDLSYWENIGNYSTWDGWRNFAEPVMIRRIEMRPGQGLIPLYWANNNYEDYINLVLAFCLGTAQCGYNPVSLWNDQFGILNRDAMNSQWVAYYDTAFEMFRATWADVDLNPAWWNNFTTQIQAAAFKMGAAHILTALNHGGASSPTLSADAARMDLSPLHDTFVWQHNPRDPITYPKQAGAQPENWELLFTNYSTQNNNKDNRDTTILPPGSFSDRIAVTVPNLVSERTRMVTVTQVPGVFYSMEGQRVNLLLPETMGSSINGPFYQSDDNYLLRVSAEYPCEILVYRPNASTQVFVNDVLAIPAATTYGGSTFVRIDVPEGDSVVRLGLPQSPGTMLIIR